MTTYFATRDSLKAHTDYDSAMAHASIHSSENLDEVKAALVDYMLNEARYLRETPTSTTLKARANAIENRIGHVITMRPDTSKSWDKVTVEVEGLEFAITASTPKPSSDETLRAAGLID